jgi:hypothetical protein
MYINILFLKLYHAVSGKPTEIFSVIQPAGF